MKTVIVYESMYGNTRVIADAIAQGLGPECEAVVVPVSQARPQLLDGADLVVVGGPTHVHGSGRPRGLTLRCMAFLKEEVP
jgi:flavodoxin